MMITELPGQYIGQGGVVQGPQYTKSCPFGGLIGGDAQQGNAGPSNGIIDKNGQFITDRNGQIITSK